MIIFYAFNIIMTGFEIAVIVVLVLLAFAILSTSTRESEGSEGFRVRGMYRPGRWRGYGGSGRFPRGPRWGRPPHWVPRGYRSFNWGPFYTPGYYDLAYRQPIYVETPEEVRKDAPGVLWCGTERCSAEETVPQTGAKDDLKACPREYNDNGFKEYTPGVLGLGESKYRRVCELTNPNEQ